MCFLYKCSATYLSILVVKILRHARNNDNADRISIVYYLELCTYVRRCLLLHYQENVIQGHRFATIYVIITHITRSVGVLKLHKGVRMYVVRRIYYVLKYNICTYDENGGCERDGNW